MSDPVRLGVLISGAGSNLQALIDAQIPGSRIVVVGADRPAEGLARAQACGIPTFVHRVRDFEDRLAFDAAVAASLLAHQVEWVVHAGFMKIAKQPLLDAFPSRMLNIHPTLLPAFPGLHPHKQVLEASVRVSGCTVHFIDEGTDTGPIVAQAVVPVLDGDDAATLKHRVQTMEHLILPRVVTWAVEGRLRLENSGVILDPRPDNPRWVIHPDLRSDALIGHRVSKCGLRTACAQNTSPPTPNRRAPCRSHSSSR